MLDVDDRMDFESLQLLKDKIQNTDRDAIYVPYVSVNSKDWVNNKHNSTVDSKSISCLPKSSRLPLS